MGKRKTAPAATEAPKSKNARHTTLESIVAQKLRESTSFRDLSQAEKTLHIDPATGLTLEKRLARDISTSASDGGKATFGGSTAADLRAIYQRTDNTFNMLSAPKDDASTWCPKLIEDRVLFFFKNCRVLNPKP